MSLPAKERFVANSILLQVELNNDDEPHKFYYSYSYKDKDKSFKKNISLTILGRSNKTDLIPTEFVNSDLYNQYVCTDEDGYIYECAIAQETKPYMVIALRSDRVK